MRQSGLIGNYKRGFRQGVVRPTLKCFPRQEIGHKSNRQHQSRTLRDDPAWINASTYGAPEQLFSGEIGRIDDVRLTA